MITYHADAYCDGLNCRAAARVTECDTSHRAMVAVGELMERKGWRTHGLMIYCPNCAPAQIASAGGAK